MISVKNLTIKEEISGRVLVSNLSFTIGKGEHIAIIGKEGVGKSSLIKAVAGIDLPYASISGEIIKSGIISYCSQVVSDIDVNKSVYDYLFLDIENDLYAKNAYELLGFFGVNIDDYSRKINTFSGGEKMKISLIKAIMVEPDILLLDEPTNDLDLDAIIFIEKFINNADIGILFISHDLRLLENTADAIIHLSQIKKNTEAKSFFKKMSYLDYYNYYLSSYEKTLMVANKEREERKKKFEKFNKIYQKVEHAQNQAVRNPFLAKQLKKKMSTLKSQEKRLEKEILTEIPEKEESINVFFNEKVFNSAKLILKLNIDKLFMNDKLLLEKIELIVKGKDKIAILGKNGIGKTTLLKRIKEELINKNQNYGYISQNYAEVLDYEKRTSIFLLENQDKYLEHELRMILGNLGFTREEMDRKISELSEGQKLKVLLLLLVAKETEVLILDEPTRNISPLNAKEIYKLFNDYNGSIIAVTHDRAFLEAVFDDIYVIENKKLIKQ